MFFILVMWKAPQISLGSDSSQEGSLHRGRVDLHTVAILAPDSPRSEADLLLLWASSVAFKKHREAPLVMPGRVKREPKWLPCLSKVGWTRKAASIINAAAGTPGCF